MSRRLPLSSCAPSALAASALLLLAIAASAATVAPPFLKPLETLKCTDSVAPPVGAPALVQTAPVTAGVGDGAWSPAGLPARVYANGLYDPLGDRMIVIDGEDAAGYVDGSLALPLDGSLHWTTLVTDGPRPVASEIVASAFDPVHTRDLVVDYAGDVWALALGGTPTWTQLVASSAGLPPGGALVYDSKRNRLVNYGGRFGLGYTNAVWALGLGDASPAWTQLFPGGPSPDGRVSAAAVYDTVGDRMVVFGGQDCTVNHNDTWALGFGDSATWVPLLPGGTAPSGAGPCAYDAAVHRMLVVTGANGSEAWALALDGGGAWSRVDGPAGPDGVPALSSSTLILDPVRGRLVDFGGVGAPGPSSAVWTLALTGGAPWQRLTGPLPTPRQWHAAMRDPLHDRMILFGGVSGQFVITYSNDLWTWSLAGDQEWHPLVAAGTPPPPMAALTTLFDPDGDRMIVYGGDTQSRVWALTLGDPPTWSDLAPSGAKPEGRWGEGAIYDPPRHRMIVFGGIVSGPTSSSRNDVWALSLVGPPVWTQLFPTGTPPTPRGFPQCIYDPAGDRMVTVGSDNVFADPGQAWSLSLAGTPAWTNLAPTGGPPVDLTYGASVYDPVSQRLVVTSSESPTTWALSLQGPPTWTKLAPAGGAPVARWGGTLVYDPLRDRAIEFGGIAGGSQLNDTWALAWNRLATPTLAALLGIDVEGGAVDVRWFVGDAARFRGSVQKSDGAGGWATQAQAIPNASGEVDYVDGAIVPGGHYGYRLWTQAATAGADPGAGTAVAEAWIDVPARLGLAFAGALPNPAVGAARIGFDLPTGGPARLELVSVAGRVVQSIEVGQLGPGAHQVTLGNAAPGVYLLRLTQGDHAVVRKLAFAR